ncbi:spondin-2-like [Corticium candelabrum]|uniref:spondin-2-like n=1 Tax=Corticium candelabrum TaxID=121492 RepID=UPI002E258362|nr:spondin-2-like [Corticium candelabrum]
MWVAGGQSTPGMKSMAEFGGQSTLNNEMRAQRSNVLDTLSFTVIYAGTGTRKGSLDVDGSHSLVSLVSMVAPSPDWFVGVHDLDLCNGATWTQSMTVDLFPYDAGTDSGLKFASANSATNPRSRSIV